MSEYIIVMIYDGYFGSADYQIFELQEGGVYVVASLSKYGLDNAPTSLDACQARMSALVDRMLDESVRRPA